MRKLLELLLAAVLALGLAACTPGGGDGTEGNGGEAAPEETDGGEETGNGGEAEPEDGGEPAAPATAMIEGTVELTGTPPEMSSLLAQMQQDPNCVAQYDPSDPPTTQSVVTGEAGALGNVFVWVSEGVQGRFPPATETYTFDQKKCRYHPHVFGVRANQDIEITNSDPTLHNVHVRSQNNGELNQGQPKGAAPIETKFRRPEQMVDIQCDIHPWMQAYAGVVAHPYFATTGPEGTFELPEKIAAGTYTVSAWHEKYGTQEQEVTVEDGATGEVSFTFDAGS